MIYLALSREVTMEVLFLGMRRQAPNLGRLGTYKLQQNRFDPISTGHGCLQSKVPYICA